MLEISMKWKALQELLKQNMSVNEHWQLKQEAKKVFNKQLRIIILCTSYIIIINIQVACRNALINNCIGYTDNVSTVDQYEQEDLLAQV